tara:strand:- start:168841 stop:169098 length:258 start_codon:yes stop_codon:yes gene_type:complete
MKLILIFCMIVSTSLFAQSSKESPKVIYKYKKYEKFDFEDLVIEGETGSPGDLSIAPRYQRKFKNVLPYRKNFHAEIKKGLERIR